MPFAEKGADGQTNGTTAVDAIPAPASSTTHVMRNVVVHNRDTIVHTVIVQKVSAGGTRRMVNQSIDPGGMLNVEVTVNCDATTSKVQVVLGEAIVTTQPDWVANYGQVT